MSLLRLLTTGKSLVGMGESEIRYRETRQKLLPRFGSAKNPFCADDSSDAARPRMSRAAEGATVSKRETVAGNAVRLPAPVAAAAAAPKLPVMLVSGKSRSPLSALWSGATALAGKWAGKASALLPQRSVRSVKVAMSRPAKLPVQAELSLDRIKVVRNDLSDADLEVVPAKLPVAPANVGPAVQSAERAGAAEKAWGRLTGRVFGVGKT
jgi:hypothetical protein